jgi:hypothetical protein
VAKKPETLFKEKVLEDLKKVPRCWFFKVEAGAVRGIPDVIICVDGLFVALELKVPPNTCEPLQEYNIYKIRKANGQAWECTPALWPEIYQIILDLSEEAA